jgi:hypothetical protein
MNAPEVAIVNGQPEVVIDAAGVASRLHTSPLGPTEALRRLKLALPADQYARIKKEYDRV